MPASFGDLDYKSPSPISIRSTFLRVQTRSATRAIRAHSSALLLPPPEFGSEPIPLLTPPRTIRRYGGSRRCNRERVTNANTDSENDTILSQPSFSQASSIEPPEVQTFLTSSTKPPTFTEQATNLVMKLYRRAETPEEPFVELQEKFELVTERITKLVKELLEKEQQLIKITNIWKSENRCGICKLHIQKPFMIRECGHSFCGPCLRLWWSFRLETRLREIPFLFWFKTDKFDPFKAPTSNESLESMLNALRLDGSNPKDVFCHSCPSCRIKVRNTPIDSVIARTMLSGVRGVLGSRPDLFPDSYEIMDESAVDGVRFFDGLFLTTIDRLDYVSDADE